MGPDGCLVVEPEYSGQDDVNEHRRPCQPSGRSNDGKLAQRTGVPVELRLDLWFRQEKLKIAQPMNGKKDAQKKTGEGH
jgi:hypothetical protein